MKPLLDILQAHLLSAFASTAILLMFLNALVNHAPEKLPASWRDAPQWFWTWTIGTWRAFLSARQGQVPKE